jgi:hypothetical protein
MCTLPFVNWFVSMYILTYVCSNLCVCLVKIKVLTLNNLFLSLFSKSPFSKKKQ